MLVRRAGASVWRPVSSAACSAGQQRGSRSLAGSPDASRHARTQFGTVTRMARMSSAALQVRSKRLFSTTPPPKKWTMYEADPSMYLHPGSECKLIHFVRHAEGIHNAAARDRPEEFWETLFNSPEMWDAPLNQAGKEQCEVLNESIVRSGIEAEVVIVSPLTRTLQTAALSFGLACPKAPMVASELCRERIAVYTSEGRAKTSELVRDWPKVDFSEITSEEDPMFDHKEEDNVNYPKKCGGISVDVPNTLPHLKVGKRGLALIDTLMARPELNIAVVSHSVFLQQLYLQFEDSLPPEFHEKRQDFATLRTVAVCPNKA